MKWGEPIIAGLVRLFLDAMVIRLEEEMSMSDRAISAELQIFGLWLLKRDLALLHILCIMGSSKKDDLLKK